MKLKLALCTVAALALVSCTRPPPFKVFAQRPQANVLPHGHTRGTYRLDVVGVSDAAHCSSPGALREVCIENLQSAYEGALNQVLRTLVRPGPENTFVARLRILSLEHSLEEPGSVAVGSGAVLHTPDTVIFTARWQFSLTHADGREVVGVAKTTQSPMPAVGNLGSLSVSVRSLNNAIVDDIARELERALQAQQDVAASKSN